MILEILRFKFLVQTQSIFHKDLCTLYLVKYPLVKNKVNSCDDMDKWMSRDGEHKHIDGQKAHKKISWPDDSLCFSA